MNALSYKVIFSKRLGTLVAVGEHASAAGKSASGQASRAVITSFAEGFVGALRFGFATVALACLSMGVTSAQSTLPKISSTALPQGSSVNSGSVAIITSGSQMALLQTTDKANVNWQSFNIGSNASVNIVQPSASAVMLNRVVGNDPSQILGKLSANGQVILLNPNGIAFGKDGSVNASSFTASTFALSEQDFAANVYKYQRNGSTAQVVNQGTIQAQSGGFVALVGATVTNEGKITAPQGDVVLAAAETVTLPAAAPTQTTTPANVSVRMSKRVRLEVAPAAINTAVTNAQSGVIVTEGGQVLMQAASLSDAVASVTHSGRIDTTAPQAGAVTLLADGGQIKVSGSITANSTATGNKGAYIIIGRDIDTGLLAKATDVSGAVLESNQGFVETSGDVLSTTGTRVKASEWLLDPYNITIAASGASGTAYASSYISGADSTILASDISANLTAGTSVTIATGAGGASAGDINVNASIAKTGGADATLTLKAHNDIVVAANTTITSTVGKLNVVLNSDLDANSAGAIVMNSGSGITSLGGNITLGGGTGGAGAGYASGYNASTRYSGVAISGSTLSAAGGNISIKGQGNTTFANVSDMRGVDLSGAVLSTSGSGNIQIDGIGGNANISNTNVGVGLTNGTTITGSSGGTVSLTGTGGNGAYYNFGVWLSGNTVKVTSPGAISLNGTAGGSGAYGTNSGVIIQSSATVEGTGSGSVSVVGVGATTTGNDNHGVEITGSGSVKSQTGSIQITGSRVANSATGSGIYLGSSATVASSGNAAVTLTTDSLGMESTSTLSAGTGTGTVTIQNRTAGTLMDVGGTSADVLTGSLKLGISSAELARITAGTIVAGRRDATATGNVAINAINMGAMGNTGGSLSVLSGGNIAVNDSITKTAGTDANLSLLANGNITVATNKTITASSGKLNVLLNSDSDASSAGSIVFNSGSGVTSNGGNITLGGGSALDGSGTAVGESVSSYAGISLATAALVAGGGNIAITGTTYRNAATNTSNVHGILITNGSINTTGAGTIALKGYSTTITDTLSKAIQISGVTITGGSTGTVSLIGDSRAATAVGNYLYGVSLGTSAVVTSLGGNIEITGYGGNGSGLYAANIGVNLSSAKVTGVGAGTVTISGTGGQGAAGSNMGVWTTGASTAVSSQGADITIIGQGGNGASSEGIFIGGGTVGVATGTTSANVILTSDSTKLATTAINSGTGTTTIQNKTAGTLINVGGADVLNTSPLTLGITNAEMNLITAGTLKIGSTTSGAMTTSAAVTTAATTGNVFLQSGSTLAASHAIASGAGLYLQTTGGALSNSAALSGTNVSLDNSNGSINLANGTITSGAGGTAAAIGVSVSGSITATNNLNIYGNQTSSDKGVQISGATTTVSGKNVTLYGNSSTGNGIAQINGTLSGEYLNVTGNTNGTVGFALQGGAIKTTGTSGTSTASIVKGISSASGNTNGYGAFMLFTGTNSASAASGTTLTLAGEATAIAAAGSAVNTNERGFFVQGYTLVTSGDVTLDGSSKGSEGVSFGGTLTMATVAGVTNKLTIKGTAGALSNAGLNAVNFSGSITGNASTSSINIVGEAKNLSGTNYDKAVNMAGSITGSSANVNIQGLYGKMSLDGAITGANISVDNTGGTIDATTGAITAGAGTSLYTNAVNINKALTATGNINVLGKVATTTNTGVNLTATAPITSSGVAKTINIDSTGNIANAAAIKNSGSTGTGANINITSTSGTITGAGAVGDTTNKNASVTFTHAATSSYSGAINAANFTKAGAGVLTLNSWVATTPATTNISNAYTVESGGLTLDPGSSLAWLMPVSVNVVNASTFSLATNSSSRWNNTAFNFTGGSGGGTMNLGGNPIGAASTTNTFSTTGGATNTVLGGLNANSANIDFNLTAATSGTSLLDGSFAAIAFTQNSQGGYGIGSSGAGGNAGTINMSGGGNLLFKDSARATTFNINAGNVQVGDGSVATASATAILDATNVSIAAGSKLTFNRAEAYSNASAITGAGSLIQAGAGVVTLTGNSSAFAGATTVNAGKTLAIGTGGSLGAAGSTLTLTDATSNLSFTNTSGTSTVASTISGLGTVTENGSGGTGVLAANNTYSGITTVTAGTLQIGNGGTTGTLGAGAVTDNAALVFNRSNAMTVVNVISGTGTLTQSGYGTSILSADNTYSGTTTITAGTLQVGVGGTVGTLGTNSGAIANSGTLTINRSDTVSIANIISGTGSLTQAGAGTTQLTGTNTYSGSTTISAGTLQVGTGGATGTLGTSAVVNNAALVFNRNATTDLTVAGAISGTGTLSQSGAGKTILTADNSYSGATSVSGGTLQIGNATTTGTLGTASAVTLSNNATLAFNRTANTTIDKTISGVGNMTANITGDLALTSNIALTGTNTINLTASGSITETAGSLAATNLYMTATNGGIGATGNRIQSNVTNLSFSGGGDVFVTEATGVNVSGRTTANNGNIDVATTLGTLTVNSVNSINGITANGTGNITLSGNAATGHGLSINNVITATNGDISLTGTTASTTYPNAGVYSLSTVSAKNITMVAESTATSGTLLGYYGAYGVFNASQTLSLTGISRSSGNGLYTYGGSYLSGTGMTVVGTSAAGQGIGFDRAVTVTNSTSGGINMTGTATQQAIGFNGVAITNGGGALTITANNGRIDSVSGWGTNTITNSGTGAVQITAGNGSATNSGSIDGSVLTITQNANAGVVVSTSGTGNVTSPKIINAGTGDIVVAAGTSIAAGTGTGGQILTVANNTLTQTNATPGKTYVYSGSADATGVLSYLSTGFASLYYQGTSQALNTGFIQAFDANHANDMSPPAGGSASGTQVFFRSTTKPGFSMALANASKAYGDTDPTLTTTSGATLTNAYAGVGGNNTFAVASADVIAGMTGSRAAGENVGTYAYTLSSSSFNTTLTAQPNLVIGKRDITLATITASNKTYNGSDAATITSGTFGNIYNNETLAISGAGTFSSKDVANGKTVTVADTTTLTKTNGTGNWNNYNLTTTSKTTTANITKATLTATANADARFVTQADAANFNGVSYSGFVGGDTSVVVGGALSISRTNALTDVAAATYTGVLVPTGLTASNYNIFYSNGNYTIVPADRLLVNTTNQTVTYGTAPTYATTAKYLDSGSNTIKVLSQTGANNNYTYNDGAGTTISLALKPYTGANVATLSSSGNTVVGTYDVKDTAYVQNGSNFNGAPVFVGSLSVDQKAITPSATGVSKVYDGTTSMGSVVVSMTGKVTNDVVTISGNGAFSQKNRGINLGYSVTGITLASADAGNYFLSGGANSFSGNDGAITAAPLVITSANVIKVYDRTTTAAGVALAAIGSQTFGSDSLSGGTFAFTSAAAGAGNKTVTVSGVTVNDGNSGNNYAVTYANNTTSTITQKALTASMGAANKTYDGTTAAIATGSSTDIITGDTVTFTNTSATFDTKNVGTGKTVSVAGISLAGTDAANYSLQSNAATTTANIAQKDVTLASITAAGKTYDGNNTASITAGSISTGVGTETLAISGAGTFSDKNAATGKTVTVADVTALTKADGTGAWSNYNLTTTGPKTSTANIAQAALSITATQVTKSYDGGLIATGTGTVGTLASGSDSVSNTGSQTFVDKNAGTGKTVTASGVTIKDSANVDMTGNYAITYTNNTTSTITQKALTASMGAANKTYDGTTAAIATGSSTDIITGDTVTFTNTSATFANANVGTGKTVSVAGISLTGTDAGNYSLQNTTATALADILAGNNSGGNGGGGGGGGGGNSTTPTFYVVPRPITPTESAESANASNFSTAGENNLLVIPALRPSADSCTPTNLEDCLCETQETRAIEGIQICYQPKKTASTVQGVGRKS